LGIEGVGVGGRSNSQRREELRGGRRSGKGEREGVWKAVTSPSSWSARSPTSWGRRMRKGGEGNQGVVVYLCRVVSTPRTVRASRAAGTPPCVSAPRDVTATRLRRRDAVTPTASPRLFHDSVSQPGRAVIVCKTGHLGLPTQHQLGSGLAFRAAWRSRGE